MRREMQAVRQGRPVAAGLVRPMLTSAVLFIAITGLAYPLATTGVAELLFRHQARGDVITRNGVGIGSEVIEQWFTKAEYFDPHPSVTTDTDPNDPNKTIDRPYNAAGSAASNLGPTSKKLVDTVAARAEDYRKENGLEPTALVPAEAVTALGSGLDPDISVANGRLQAKCVAAARGIPEPQVLALADAHTQGRQFGLLGYPRVNVPVLNIALDDQTPRTPQK
jgi:potassium-transporting ATPase KdpC subunit